MRTLHTYWHGHIGGAHRMGRTQLCRRNPASRSTGRHLHDATVLVVSAKLPSRPAKSTGHILRTYDDARPRDCPKGHSGWRLAWD